MCGIQLEQKAESKNFETTHACSESSPHGDGYSSGVIKDIWTKMVGRSSVAAVETERTGEELFSTDVNNYCCCLDTEAKMEALQEPSRAVQRSEYHLWEGQKENMEKRAFVSSELSKVDGGDYTTPSKPWDVAQDKENTFILGGVYGELKTFNSDGEWAVVPPGHTKGSLLQCAASDVVTIAGTDVFMTPGNSFAPGHRQLWKPFVSFEQSDMPKRGENGVNKGFSFIFHEDLLGACSNFQVEDPGLEYSLSSFDLSNPFSQVLHVECSFEPEGIASLAPVSSRNQSSALIQTVRFFTPEYVVSKGHSTGLFESLPGLTFARFLHLNYPLEEEVSQNSNLKKMKRVFPFLPMLMYLKTHKQISNL